MSMLHLSSVKTLSQLLFSPLPLRSPLQFSHKICLAFLVLYLCLLVSKISVCVPLSFPWHEVPVVCNPFSRQLFIFSLFYLGKKKNSRRFFCVLFVVTLVISIVTALASRSSPRCCSFHSSRTLFTTSFTLPCHCSFSLKNPWPSPSTSPLASSPFPPPSWNPPVCPPHTSVFLENC